MEIRLGWFSILNKSDVWLMESFPSTFKDYDFEWENFSNGKELVEAALEIKYRDIDMLAPSARWKTCVAMSRQFTAGFQENRNSFILEIAMLNSFTDSDSRRRLTGKSMKRMKEFFQIV